MPGAPRDDEPLASIEKRSAMMSIHRIDVHRKEKTFSGGTPEEKKKRSFFSGCTSSARCCPMVLKKKNKAIETFNLDITLTTYPEKESNLFHSSFNTVLYR